MRGIGCCIALVAGTLVIAPTTDAVTFGADLGRPADNTYACSDFGGGPTCSAESSNPYTGENGFPPVGTGVVTQVRVKVGPVTGPMQIVVEQALRQDNPGDPGHPIYACCTAIDASGVFTPRPNAVTAINVNLPVRQDLTPNGNGVYVDQHLSLSVLSANVPIPASSDQNASVGLWFPAWHVGDERAGSYGTAGADILFNADWQASGAGFSGGGSPVALAGRSARVSGGQAVIELTCNLSKTCKGKLTLADQQAIVAPPFGPDVAPPFSAGKRAKTYGSARFRIKPRQTEAVTAKLKGPGKHLLDDRPKAKVWGNVQLEDSSALAASFRVQLER
ncbi:MAG TPA: hypothetical protein VID76_08405 [Solirubrobacterales bacterium]|jgi:hypothetical protein